MDYKRILITGGAGFVGSNIAVKLKQHFNGIEVIAADNLKRRGSEFNIPRLELHGIKFIHSDIRLIDDIDIPNDLIIDCSADAAPTSGIISTSSHSVQTNLVGSINCFEIAKKYRADVIFFSTSRVYPVDLLNTIKFRETKNQITINSDQKIKGVTKLGIDESFPLRGDVRSLYGATKLASELLLKEYIDAYKVRGIIYRPGSVAGPWQMSYEYQGFVTHWLASHALKKPLKYIGFGGNGTQVRDILHIDDLSDLIISQLSNIKLHSGKIYNIGGGIKNSLTLKRLTKLCTEITGNKIPILGEKKKRKWDIKFYISNNSFINSTTGWAPKKTLTETLSDTFNWLNAHKEISDYFQGNFSLENKHKN